jgi:hypothetical protein
VRKRRSNQNQKPTAGNAKGQKKIDVITSVSENSMGASSKLHRFPVTSSDAAVLCTVVTSKTYRSNKEPPTWLA